MFKFKTMKNIISLTFLCCFITAVNAAQFGPIKNSDTLWSIAKANKPTNISIQDYMVKIYIRLNYAG